MLNQIQPCEAEFNLLLVGGLNADDTRRLLNGENEDGENWPFIVRVFDVLDNDINFYSGSVLTDFGGSNPNGKLGTFSTFLANV